MVDLRIADRFGEIDLLQLVAEPEGTCFGVAFIAAAGLDSLCADS